jgi:GntR family transcriptional regulator
MRVDYFMRENPLYLDIAASIRNDILSQVLEPHTRLPSEPDLVKRFGAARATVRRALAKLQDEGLIYAKQKVGSFVAEPRVEQDLDQLVSFTQFMVYKGMKPSSKLITTAVQKVEDPHSPLLHYLGLRAGAKVVYIRRLRLGGRQPLVIANTWLPESRFPGFIKQNLERRSVYDVMEAMGHRPTDAIQTMEAVTLEKDDATLLTVPTGSAALLIRRVGYARGVPVEYAIDYYRGDRTKFRVRLGVLEQRLAGRIHDEHIAI